MVNPEDVYRRQEEDWVSRFVWDEVVIMPLCRKDEDLQYIYSISNETGSAIWKLLDGKHSVLQIQKALESEFQGQAQVIEKDLRKFLNNLLEAALIQEVRKKSKAEKAVSEKQKPDKKRRYHRPEISKVKLQPEQAVLACCSVYERYQKKPGAFNFCSTTSFCLDPGCTNPWKSDSYSTSGSS